MKIKNNLSLSISLGFLFLLGLSSFGTGTVKYGNKVKPGEFIIDPPTLICLGFEWRIEGDDNRNAAVQVKYRKKGITAWKEALPLLRLQHEEAGGSLVPDYVVPNMFAGSILDLEPDTEYECKFQMLDQDGVLGTAQKMATVRTRPEPKPFAGGRILHVYTADYKGSKEKQTFTGLRAAYEEAKPGDIILVHAGLYQSDRTMYLDYLRKGVGSDVFGTTRLTKSGSPEKPIVIKGAGDGETIFDGNGCSILFDVIGANYAYFEGITFRNADVAIHTGLKDVAGCSGLTVKRCRFENVAEAIRGTYQGSKNYYIADNVVIGRNDPTRLMGLFSREVPFNTLPGYPLKIGGPKGSNNAITVSGQGHVVCHNRVENFFDGIDTYQAAGAPKEGHDAESPISIDFYNNYISNVGDNCFETDCSSHNIRVLRNMCINGAHATLSSQPVYGGPVYWICNIVYHAPDRGAIKMYSRPAGVILYHNTFCAEVIVGQAPDMGASNLHFRNNLMLGENPVSLTNYIPMDFRGIFFMDTYTSYTTSDYDGFRPNEGFDIQFAWNSPAGGVRTDYKNPREVHAFKTLKELCAATGQECHGIMIDYDIFQNVKKADLASFSKIYNAKDMDFRLKPDSAAVDAGCILPNVNDGFIGKAPDLGALEVGQPVPIYGQRP
jgi:hypothetical protein